MNVRNCCAFNENEAAKLEVFTNLKEELLNCICNRNAAVGNCCCKKCIEVSRLCFNNCLCNLICKSLECGAVAYEVCFAVKLNKS